MGEAGALAAKVLAFVFPVSTVVISLLSVFRPFQRALEGPSCALDVRQLGQYAYTALASRSFGENKQKGDLSSRALPDLGVLFVSWLLGLAVDLCTGGGVGACASGCS